MNKFPAHRKSKSLLLPGNLELTKNMNKYLKSDSNRDDNGLWHVYWGRGGKIRRTENLKTWQFDIVTHVRQCNVCFVRIYFNFVLSNVLEVSPLKTLNSLEDSLNVQFVQTQTCYVMLYLSECSVLGDALAEHWQSIYSPPLQDLMFALCVYFLCCVYCVLCILCIVYYWVHYVLLWLWKTYGAYTGNSPSTHHLLTIPRLNSFKLLKLCEL